MRGDLREWLESCKPDLFLTFNFGYSVRPLNGQAPMREWCKRMERLALGRNWSKYPREERLTVIGAWEKVERFSNTHCHVVGWGPPRLRQAVYTYGTERWVDLVQRGQLHIETPRRASKVVSYITKELPKHTGEGFDRLFVY